MSNVALTDTIEVPVQYLEKDSDLAVYRASVAGGELVDHQGNYVMHKVSVENARNYEEQTSLDIEGFKLISQPTQVSDFYDDGQLVAYELEVQQILIQETGAREVAIFDHTRRSSSSSIRAAQKIREASSVIHNDYSAESGHIRLKDYLDSQQTAQSEKLQNRDFAIINVWRSMKSTILNFPLAMCRANSVDAEDLISVMREGKERTGEIQLVVHNADHRWSYFPNMHRDEALIFKTFDSRVDGRARFTPHTSFDDPAAPADAAPRESIETRCFVYF